MTGILCGKCQDGKGLSVLLNKCKSCSKFNLLLIPALGISIAHILYVTIRLNLIWHYKWWYVATHGMHCIGKLQVPAKPNCYVAS